jgi:serine/threonine protein kinase
MGSVYLAHDPQLDRRVALKVPHFTAEDGPDVLERFRREARAAATIEHPNICPVYDVGEADGVNYLSMAYIEGRPLSDLLKGGKPQPQRGVAAVVRKLALALEEAHKKGVIHRDLKPSNVMINRRKEPVLMDFGLARRVGGGEARLTRSGSVMGTPAYMPPEQVNGDVAAMGPACDVYSLGVILYELLTGRLPFEGPVMAVLARIVTQEPEPPSRHRADLDPRLDVICRKAMAKRAADRYATMAERAAALARYLKGNSQAPAVATGSSPQQGGKESMVSQLFADIVALQESKHSQPRPKGGPSGRGPHGLWLVAGGAAVASLLIGIVILIRNEDGSTTRIEVPDSAKVEIQKDGKTIPISGSTGSPKPTDEVMKSINLLAMIDSARDRVQGEWRLIQGILITPGHSNHWVPDCRLPMSPPKNISWKLWLSVLGSRVTSLWASS